MLYVRPREAAISTVFKTPPRDGVPPRGHRRERAVREGVASATIEGGAVAPEAQAIMDQWAQGLIDEEVAIARIKAMYGV
jgi:hypothetical protein